MKNSLIASGAVLLGLNAAAVYFPQQNLTLAAQTASAAIGMVLVFLAIRPKPKQQPESAKTSPPPPPRAEAEIVAFLALLQEHGRLVDFTKEDIAAASDAQLGSAARVVHAGCRKVLDEYFDISPLQSESEGSTLTLEAGFDAPAYKLLGSVPDQPPYQGKLLHPGWAARSVKLPRVTGTSAQRPWPVLAPAEVEVGAN
ncbi:MAG: DUF2760 domain-containing protein [bacterium]